MPDANGRFKGIQVPRLPPSMSKAETEEALDEFVDIDLEPDPVYVAGERVNVIAKPCSTCGSTAIPCRCPE